MKDKYYKGRVVYPHVLFALWPKVPLSETRNGEIRYIYIYIFNSEYKRECFVHPTSGNYNISSHLKTNKSHT